MKSLLPLLLLFVASMAMAQTQKEPKVLFIGIDGVRSDALIQANTPNMDELFDNGIYTFDSWHLGITVSGPSWSTMLTGVWEPKHKVLNNSYTNADYANFPYFFKRLKEYRPDAKCVQIITWNQMGTTDNVGGYVYNSGLDLSIDAGTHSQGLITAAAQIQLLDPELDVLFIHYDEPDATGHSSTFTPNNPQYINVIQDVDTQIGQVMSYLQARPTYDQEDWLILGTTDHGGTGFGHGGNSNVERHIWWFASGESAPKTEIIGPDPGSYQMPNNPVNAQLLENTPVLADIAVTALDHLLKGIVEPETFIPEWDLDGKSWLDNTTFVENDKKNWRDKNSFDVYPNPSNGQFNVSFNEPLDGTDLRWKVTAADGRLISENEIARGSEQFEVDITALNAGIYFLSVQDGKQTFTRKILKK